MCLDVTQEDCRTPVKANKSGDVLHDKLKQLGEAFLEEEVPEALLDVLRRAAAERSKRAETDSEACSDSDPIQDGDAKGER